VRILTQLDEWRSATADARLARQSVGLVPTMGALHEGHRSLVAAARAECDVVVVTIFVNPRQFSNSTDLATYPRELEHDAELCDEWGVDLLVVPSLEEMWPDPVLTSVHVGALSEHLEGVGRPGHFDGVASVVTKLFVVNGPCRAYFGEKDFQQLAVVRQLTRDLGFDVTIVACPIVRDEEGLALSSRNARLSASSRDSALGLSRTLRRVAAASGLSAGAARELMVTSLAEAQVETAYAEIVSNETLMPLGDDEAAIGRAVIAGFVDGVRLLDNGPVGK